MDCGSYTKVDFEAFRVQRFIPYLYAGLYGGLGCGASALSLLTGINPVSLPRKSDWTNRFMCSFLLKKNFKLAKLTKRNITNFETVCYPVAKRHVILASIKFIRNEASWVVIYNDILFHNFEAQIFSQYELINHPLMTAYLLKHPSWSIRPSVEKFLWPGKKGSK